jgi:hypothetical protein
LTSKDDADVNDTFVPKTYTVVNGVVMTLQDEWDYDKA